jgi:hypothetical protein
MPTGPQGGKPDEIEGIRKALTSGDPELEDAGIRALEQFGSDRAIAVLAGCLNRKSWRQSKGFDPSWRGPKGERLQGRVVYQPLSHMAARALARMVPDPPIGHDQDPMTEDVIERWRLWWIDHRARYEPANTREC